MVLANAITSAICGGSTVAAYYLLDESLSPAERWTVLGALMAVVLTIVFRLTAKVDKLGENIHSGLAAVGDSVNKNTTEGSRLRDTMQTLITQLVETNRIAATERDKAVAALKEHIDLRCGPKE